ncbi:MAG TPA: response regulator [Bacteroidales bacterium]|jgi:CheY-like chemotaxis protein|nr:response regulator [Bacteroidales bacterium]
MKDTEDSVLNTIEILIVEDNKGDARLIKEVFYENKIFNSLHFVNDGIEAMDFLHSKGVYKNVATPDLIILDLNLPRKDGREVLAEIKSDEKLKHIPVVVMTISQADEDVLRSYNLHANCYVTKPIDLNEFTRVIRSIEDFWFSVVKLPPKKK